MTTAKNFSLIILNNFVFENPRTMEEKCAKFSTSKVDGEDGEPTDGEHPQHRGDQGEQVAQT